MTVDREYAFPAKYVPCETVRGATRFGRVDIAGVVDIAYSFTVDVE